MSADVRDDFFIGWLPMPRSCIRFLVPIVVAFGAVTLLAAATLAFFQRDPGAGQWDADRIVTMRGLAFARPYAMLRVVGDGAEARTYLLVEDGKFGALPRVSRFVEWHPEGVPVEIRGTILHRGDRWMIAIEDGDTNMRSLTDAEAKTLPSLGGSPPTNLAESIALEGEIIDPKCYLGAMKPGGGKTHKACAMRCISGGIPPMLVTRDETGSETFYLLVASDGGVANESLFPFVGDRVRLTGHLERRDDLLVVKTANVARR